MGRERRREIHTQTKSRREEKEEEARTKYQMERERKTHSCSEGEERGGRGSRPRETPGGRGGGAASSWVGMGTWGFVYYPTGTEPGASFIGFWLRDE